MKSVLRVFLSLLLPLASLPPGVFASGDGQSFEWEGQDANWSDWYRVKAKDGSGKSYFCHKSDCYRKPPTATVVNRHDGSSDIVLSDGVSFALTDPYQDRAALGASIFRRPSTPFEVLLSPRRDGGIIDLTRMGYGRGASDWDPRHPVIFDPRSYPGDRVSPIWGGVGFDRRGRTDSRPVIGASGRILLMQNVRTGEMSMAPMELILGKNFTPLSMGGGSGRLTALPSWEPVASSDGGSGRIEVISQDGPGGFMPVTQGGPMGAADRPVIIFRPRQADLSRVISSRNDVLSMIEREGDEPAMILDLGSASGGRSSLTDGKRPIIFVSQEARMVPGLDPLGSRRQGLEFQVSDQVLGDRNSPIFIAPDRRSRDQLSVDRFDLRVAPEIGGAATGTDGLVLTGRNGLISMMPGGSANWEPHILMGVQDTNTGQWTFAPGSEKVTEALTPVSPFTLVSADNAGSEEADKDGAPAEREEPDPNAGALWKEKAGEADVPLFEWKRADEPVRTLKGTVSYEQVDMETTRFSLIRKEGEENRDKAFIIESGADPSNAKEAVIEVAGAGPITARIYKPPPPFDLAEKIDDLERSVLAASGEDDPDAMLDRLDRRYKRDKEGGEEKMLEVRRRVLDAVEAYLREPPSGPLTDFERNYMLDRLARTDPALKDRAEILVNQGMSDAEAYKNFSIQARAKIQEDFRARKEGSRDDKDALGTWAKASIPADPELSRLFPSAEAEEREAEASADEARRRTEARAAEVINGMFDGAAQKAVAEHLARTWGGASDPRAGMEAFLKAYDDAGGDAKKGDFAASLKVEDRIGAVVYMRAADGVADPDKKAEAQAGLKAWLEGRGLDEAETRSLSAWLGQRNIDESTMLEMYCPTVLAADGGGAAEEASKSTREELERTEADMAGRRGLDLPEDGAAASRLDQGASEGDAVVGGAGSSSYPAALREKCVAWAASQRPRSQPPRSRGEREVEVPTPGDGIEHLPGAGSGNLAGRSEKVGEDKAGAGKGKDEKKSDFWGNMGKAAKMGMAGAVVFGLIGMLFGGPIGFLLGAAVGFAATTAVTAANNARG